MMLSDREWLRFVTFGIVAGAVMGALYTGALLINGQNIIGAMAGSIVGCAIFALLIHVVIRKLLDRALEPEAPDDSEDAEAST